MPIYSSAILRPSTLLGEKRDAGVILTLVSIFHILAACQELLSYVVTAKPAKKKALFPKATLIDKLAVEKMPVVAKKQEEKVDTGVAGLICKRFSGMHHFGKLRSES